MAQDAADLMLDSDDEAELVGGDERVAGVLEVGEQRECSVRQVKSRRSGGGTRLANAGEQPRSVGCADDVEDRAEHEVGIVFLDGVAGGDHHLLRPRA